MTVSGMRSGLFTLVLSGCLSDDEPLWNEPESPVSDYVVASQTSTTTTEHSLNSFRASSEQPKRHVAPTKRSRSQPLSATVIPNLAITLGTLGLGTIGLGFFGFRTWRIFNSPMNQKNPQLEDLLQKFNAARAAVYLLRKSPDNRDARLHANIEVGKTGAEYFRAWLRNRQSIYRDILTSRFPGRERRIFAETALDSLSNMEDNLGELYRRISTLEATLQDSGNPDHMARSIRDQVDVLVSLELDFLNFEIRARIP